MIREFIGDIAKYLPSYVIPAVVGVVALPIVTRLFAPGDYGNYALVTTTIALLSAFASTWLCGAIIRFFTARQLDNRLDEFHGTVLKLALISVTGISLLALGILFLARSYISPNLYSLMRIGLLVFMAVSFYNIFLDTLRAKRGVGWYSSFAVWRSVIGLGLGMALVVGFHYGVEGLLWGSLLSMVLAFPLLWKVSIGKPSFRKGRVRSSLTSEMIKYGFPLIAVNIASWIATLSDRYVIEFFRGSEEVGIYAIAYAISHGGLALIVSAFRLSVLPMGVNIWETQGVERSRDFLTKVTRYYLLLALPAAVGLSLLAKPVMSVLTTPAYFPGYRIISVLAFAFFLLGLDGRFGVVLNLYKKTHLNMICTFVMAALNLGLNILLIPKYGYMAAAVTTFIAFAVDLIMKIFISRHFLVWQFPFKSLGRIAAASAGMGIAVYYIGSGLTTSNLINLIVGICVGAIIYFAMLFLLREFQTDEIEWVRTWAARIFKRG